MKVSPAFSKAAGCRGAAPARAPLKRGTLFLLTKDQEGGLRGKPYQGVSPFFLYVCACAPLRWEVGVGLSCRSTPFLWCLPKETVSSRQRKAPFLPRWLHHPRERYRSVVYTFLARLLQGAGACRGIVRVRRFVGRWIVAPTADSTPFLCSCAKKRGGAPKKRAFGCRHGSCSVPPASPTDSKPQHHRRLRQADLSARSTHRVQINLTHQFVPLGLRAEWERRAGPPSSCGGFKALFFGGSTPFLLARQKKWGRIAGQGNDYRPRKRRTRTSVKKRDPRGGGPFDIELLTDCRRSRRGIWRRAFAASRWSASGGRRRSAGSSAPPPSAGRRPARGSRRAT